MNAILRSAPVVLLLALAPAALAVDAGAPAPTLTMPRLGKGEPLQLASLKGQVVYVDFWASWCGPCKLSMPVLDSMQKRLGARGFTVVGVNKDATAAEALKFLEHVKVDFTLVADSGDAVAKAFEVKTMPSGYLIDRKGVVRFVHRGFTSETPGALEKQVETLLKEPA